MDRRTALQTIALASAAPAASLAQDKPPIKILVGFVAGGSADVAARMIAERIGPDLKQTVVVDNKPGAAGRIAAELLKNAAPDGTTLMICPIVVPILAPMTFSKLNYNPATDMTPVIQVATLGFAMAVHADHPARNVQELLAWFRANPGKGNFGTPGAGSLPHFFGVMLSRAAGIDLVHVPFNGGAPAIQALIGGQTTCTFDTVTDLVQQHRGGKIRVLATAGAARSPQLPDVPTFTEQGLRDVQGSSWFAIYAPGKTPEGTVRSMNAAINKALADPALREKFSAMGMEATGGSVDDLVTITRRDTERWGPVVKASGFRGD
jgi:tripartite-type tricarboxylate transporter receptor subunit TctC